MEYEIIQRGKARFGEGPYEVQNVRTSTVVVLRPSESSGIDVGRAGLAVMNLPPTNPPSTSKAIDSLVDKYLERTGVPLDRIEAVFVGGVFVEHRSKPNGLIVAYNHDLAAKCVLEALATYGVRTNPVKTDVMATKTVRIEKDGGVHIDEIVEGLNNVDAQMSEEDYRFRFERYECCD